MLRIFESNAFKTDWKKGREDIIMHKQNQKLFLI